MKQRNRNGNGGHILLFLQKKRKKRRKKQRWGQSLIYLLCVIVFAGAAIWLGGYGIFTVWQSRHAHKIQEKLRSMKKAATVFVPSEIQYDRNGFPVAGVDAFWDDLFREILIMERNPEPAVMPRYQSLYEINHDMAGWLSIEGTIIDYPVMQTPEDENYYLNLDFYKQPDKNGCLILDTDSEAGIGTKDCGYADGNAPSTNLIIHGHTMKSGDMFGNLQLYAEEKYGKEHSRICFDSLYEERVYELIAVFYSQVYYEKDEVFKYYKFFQADTEEDFYEWYRNIKAMSLYDTGVGAEFGDEFITLSCCSYQVEDGRFVVVGKRIM